MKLSTVLIDIIVAFAFCFSLLFERRGTDPSTPKKPLVFTGFLVLLVYGPRFLSS